MSRRVGFVGGALRVDGHEYSLERYSRLVLIAMGKAGGTLARAFLHVAGAFAGRFEGVVVAPELVELEKARLARVSRGTSFAERGFCGGGRGYFEDAGGVDRE